MYDFGARFCQILQDGVSWIHWLRNIPDYNYGVNNPIINIDPDGRSVETLNESYEGMEAQEAFRRLQKQMAKNKPPDDHFNQYGKFLYTDNKKTNNVVIDFQNPINGKIVKAPGHSKELKDYIFRTSDDYNMLNNISLHYASKKGIPKNSFANGRISTYDTYGMKFWGSTLDTWEKTATNGGRHAMQYIQGQLVHPILFKKKYKRFEINSPWMYSRFYIYPTDTILPYSIYKHAEIDYRGRLERIDSYNKKTDVFVTLQIITKKGWDIQTGEIFEFNHYLDSRNSK